MVNTQLLQKQKLKKKKKKSRITRPMTVVVPNEKKKITEKTDQHRPEQH